MSVYEREDVVLELICFSGSTEEGEKKGWQRSTDQAKHQALTVILNTAQFRKFKTTA